MSVPATGSTRSLRWRSDLRFSPQRVPCTADSMMVTNVPDDTANEQRWPTEEEMAGAAT
ncbi:hypothetical protein HD554DRAFT_2077148 [Boletus coccyginus]|nr:hypothetical protein HD554DRAFT_2077148 [Boletus coccyginus]